MDSLSLLTRPAAWTFRASIDVIASIFLPDREERTERVLQPQPCPSARALSVHVLTRLATIVTTEPPSPACSSSTGFQEKLADAFRDLRAVLWQAR